MSSYKSRAQLERREQREKKIAQRRAEEQRLRRAAKHPKKDPRTWGEFWQQLERVVGKSLTEFETAREVAKDYGFNRPKTTRSGAWSAKHAWRKDAGGSSLLVLAPTAAELIAAMKEKGSKKVPAEEKATKKREAR